ncbi:MAG: hypothetical protein AB8H03_17090 [Saprospiraceae bacterium]
MSDAQSNETRQLLPKFSRAEVTSFIALVVSLGALCVSIYEANIMREQQIIMQSQQKTSVFPYLVQDLRYSFGEGGEFIYEIENKGIGPAKIKSATLTLNNKSVNSFLEIKNELDKIFPPEADYGLSLSSPDGYFISPKEKIIAIKITYKRFENSMNLIRNLNFKYDIIYCSIFNDCWDINTDKKED